MMTPAAFSEESVSSASASSSVLAVGGKDEGQVAARGGLRFDAPAQAHVEGIERIRENQPDDLGAPAVQVDREEVGPKSGLFSPILDLLAHLEADRTGVLEVFRDGRPRQANRLGELFHRPCTRLVIAVPPVAEQCCHRAASDQHNWRATMKIFTRSK